MPLGDTTNEADANMDYHIQMITKEDIPRVLKFLRRFFFRDEPLNHSIQLIPEGEDSTCVELEEYCMISVEDNLSYMAVTTNGSIIGVQLNGKMEPLKDDEPEYISSCKNSKFKKILRLLRYIDLNVNRAGRFSGQNVIEIRILSVDSTWRGRGVAKALMEKTIEIAKERNFQILRCDCTSFFSGKLCEKFGFEICYEVKYADYVDENGTPIFHPSPPHTAAVTYITKL
ncbi:dopamine N-acetyltransferase isoform X2 [Cephus cinctus]|uniref:aralkylamine N-acetyltransferase n=1 Tax=Cephus cinctus TaxID=211228 RepID=A0AAJ7RAI6_CEPCN|nr:dopamine N-acetyltransferase isoform X2 [Cephus cinctus]